MAFQQVHFMHCGRKLDQVNKFSQENVHCETQLMNRIILANAVHEGETNHHLYRSGCRQ